MAGVAFGIMACGENTSTNSDAELSSALELSSMTAYSSDIYSSSSGWIVIPESSTATEVSSSSTDPLGMSSSDGLSSSGAISSSSAWIIFPESSSSLAESSSSESSSSSVPPVGNDFVEDHRSECSIPAIPSGTNTKLPNPFKMMDGTSVTTKTQWTCRREEMAAMFEATELGEKPRKPESVTGSYLNGTLTVTVTDKGKTVSFTASISGGGTASDPVPAVIGFGGGSLGTSYSGMGVATINFNQDAVAPETPRGSGPFYTLYGSNHTAGALIAWAWGVSRIIDALEVTPEAGIKVQKLAVNGCSRYGKGALVVGAFDQRIALVIPQESGSGGASNWRSVALDSKAQPLSHACQEAAWFKSTFCNYGSSTNTLPTDHHMLTGMVAPRGLLVLDNVGWDWLGETPSYHNAMSTKEIFDALDATEDYTYSQIGDHMHCTLPQTQYHWVQSYVKKYLLDQTGEQAKIETKANVTFTKSQWIDWTTPILQ